MAYLVRLENSRIINNLTYRITCNGDDPALIQMTGTLRERRYACAHCEVTLDLSTPKGLEHFLISAISESPAPMVFGDYVGMLQVQLTFGAGDPARNARERLVLMDLYPPSG